MQRIKHSDRHCVRYTQHLKTQSRKEKNNKTKTEKLSKSVKVNIDKYFECEKAVTEYKESNTGTETTKTRKQQALEIIYVSEVTDGIKDKAISFMRRAFAGQEAIKYGRKSTTSNKLYQGHR